MTVHHLHNLLPEKTELSVMEHTSSRWIKHDEAGERLVDPWPTIFYLGVPKAGSTSLFFFLQKHPHVCPGHMKDRPDLVNKEVDFFIRPDLFKLGAPMYMSFFDRSQKCLDLARNGIRGSFFDASTKYLLDIGAASRMKATYPQDMLERLKFIVVLREPVERDRSWQGQKKRCTELQSTISVDTGSCLASLKLYD